MITVQRSNLASALKRASKLLPRTPTIPALRTVRLAIDHEGIVFRSTNLEQALVEALPATTSERTTAVSICVNVVPLLGIVNALPEHVSDVRITARPDHLIVETTKLPAGCALADYPTIPRMPDRVQAMIELPGDLMQSVRFVRSAVSKETYRAPLQGMLFDFANGNLVGCDGKHLHCAHLWERSKIANLLLPPSIFDVDVPTHLHVPQSGKNGVQEAFLILENGYLAAKTLEGNYPDYLAIVRKEHLNTAVVNREELASAVEQALPMVNERSPSCTLHLNDRFEIQAEDADTKAEYQNEVSASLDGLEIKVSLNPHVLLATLRTMPGQEVTLAFRKPDEAVHVVSDSGNHWALIMPLTLHNPTPAPSRVHAKQ